MHNMELCGTATPMVPGKQPPVQLPLPIPAPLHAPHKGSLGSAVLSKDVEIGDALILIYPRLHTAKGQASHPSDFFCKYQLHTGRGEQCLDITQKFLFTTRHLCTPENIWRSVLSCYWSWSHKQKVGGKQVTPQLISAHPTPASTPSSAGMLLGPGQSHTHAWAPSACTPPFSQNKYMFLPCSSNPGFSAGPSSCHGERLKSFNKLYFSFFKKKVKQGFEEKNN